MRLELKDAYSHLHIIRVHIFNISNIIPVVLLASIDDEFFKYLDILLLIFLNRIKYIRTLIGE